MSKKFGMPLPNPVNLTEDIGAEPFVLPPNIGSINYSYGSMFEMDDLRKRVRIFGQESYETPKKEKRE